MKKTALALIVLSVPLFLSAEEERAPLASRPLKSETLAHLQHQREKELAEPADVAEPIHERAGFYPDAYPAIYFPNNCHWIVGISAVGDSLEIEDGSIWKLSSHTGYKALNWYSNDPLMITQNHSLFSSYNYRILNRNTGSFIEANLFAGPVLNGEFSKFIIGIDCAEGVIVLSDHSRWSVSLLDQYMLAEWDLNDYVIIGYNTGWDKSSDGLLINSNANSHVRARQF